MRTKMDLSESDYQELHREDRVTKMTSLSMETSLNYNCDKVESKEGGLRRDGVEKDLLDRDGEREGEGEGEEGERGGERGGRERLH